MAGVAQGPFSHQDLAEWAAARRVGGHLAAGRADLSICGARKGQRALEGACWRRRQRIISTAWQAPRDCRPDSRGCS